MNCMASIPCSDVLWEILYTVCVYVFGRMSFMIDLSIDVLKIGEMGTPPNITG